ncbi:MAG: flippase-like domain-containing protein, partial [Synergistaceae bacterium]|nr:flippase-like domain-containing protein [Synergistaceae bacterium]
MSKGGKISVKFLLQLSVSLICVYYAFSGIELSTLWMTIKNYSQGAIILVFSVSLLSYLALGLRLKYMRIPALPFWDCVKAGLLCLGANNIFPAKAGEIIKAAWLSRRNGFPFAAALGIVFWERFSDVNMLLSIGVWTAWTLDIDSGLLAGILILAGVWIALFFARKFPAFFPALFSKIKINKLADFIGTLQNEVSSNMTLKKLSWLAGSTALVWAAYAAGSILSLKYVAELNVNMTQGLCIFAISSLGMLLPSTPGAVGVYEASTVLALSWFGVEKEQALGIALF